MVETGALMVHTISNANPCCKKSRKYWINRAETQSSWARHKLLNPLNSSINFAREWLFQVSILSYRSNRGSKAFQSTQRFHIHWSCNKSLSYGGTQ
ncbi:hypothetical protein XENTR_v10014328 [Xenopus tropicalis]|nr:hypothetical protein XENTR_v10014328 [Xenopus tropicalis]